MTLDLKDRLYTSSEVAEILGVSLRSVYRYLEEGKLDADIKTATGRHRFSKRNILDFLQPGGITKEQAENQFSNNSSYDDEEFDVLDLPALSKAKKIDESYDDFSFDLDEDFFKSLDFDNTGNKKDEINTNNTQISGNNLSKMDGGDYIDDDLEKLLKEFEDRELNSESENISKDIPEQKNPIKTSSTSLNDEDDFDLDEFFKELEAETANDKVSSSFEKDALVVNKESKKDDFDFDFDLDFFEDALDTDTNSTKNSNTYTDLRLKEAADNSQNILKNKKEFDIETEDNAEDNWLERFRKAASKNSQEAPINSTKQEKKDNLNDSFFENSNLDHFFGNTNSKSPLDSVSSLSSLSSLGNKVENPAKKRELYYTSSLNGLKEIAQNIDKIAKKFDTDYAFTLNAGLSLHKPISPFTLIHVYVSSRDLELFEDYLNLTAVENPSEASVCLMIPEDISLFEDSYELHGLYVVSNVQLRSDLIDKGLDKLAREI